MVCSHAKAYWSSNLVGVENLISRNFRRKDWSDIVFSYNYKYWSGPLADYALKKLNLLVDADPALTKISRVNLIVIGLPLLVRDRIDRAKVTSFSALMRELNQLESLATISVKNKFNSKGTPNVFSGENKSSGQKKERKPCSICEKMKKFNRMHPKSECFFRPDKEENIKVTNNNELEEAMNAEIDAKN